MGSDKDTTRATAHAENLAQAGEDWSTYRNQAGQARERGLARQLSAFGPANTVLSGMMGGADTINLQEAARNPFAPSPTYRVIQPPQARPAPNPSLGPASGVVTPGNPSLGPASGVVTPGNPSLGPATEVMGPGPTPVEGLPPGQRGNF